MFLRFQDESDQEIFIDATVDSAVAEYETSFTDWY